MKENSVFRERIATPWLDDGCVDMAILLGI